MPLYEYECIKNGHRFELIRKFSDPPVTTCIKCRSKVRKLLSPPAIAFKGSGWYVTDYGKGGSGSSKAKDRGGEPKGGGESGSKAEPEAKKDKKESAGSSAKKPSKD